MVSFRLRRDCETLLVWFMGQGTQTHPNPQTKPTMHPCWDPQTRISLEDLHHAGGSLEDPGTQDSIQGKNFRRLL